MANSFIPCKHGHGDFCGMSGCEYLPTMVKLERKLEIAGEYLKAIAEPALGGKLQQLAAKEALKRIAEVG